MTEEIGKVKLNLDYYNGEDLYSDGDTVENKILNIVKNGDDYGYYHKDFHDWAVLYHLSRQRENIVDPMDINSTDEVLEIGSGMGAVSGAFAKRCKKLDCIELSRRRSTMYAYRHADLDNIEIFVGNFQDVKIEKQYDVVTLIGVLEYGYHYITGDKPYEQFLEKIYSCLKPGGRLYIAIENRLGMKYFAGYNEDHLGRAFRGIEGYTPEDKVKTFSKKELESLLYATGFGTHVFYYPFPDYKLPTVIYDEDTIKNMAIEYPNQINYDTEVLSTFNQNAAFLSLQGSDEISTFANSFLVETVKE